MVKINSVDIVKTEADMSMLNTSISVGKINEKETNTSACYTGIILVKMECQKDINMLNTVYLLVK